MPGIPSISIDTTKMRPPARRACGPTSHAYTFFSSPARVLRGLCTGCGGDCCLDESAYGGAGSGTGSRG
eukprot:12501216-Prorocentrum_lima.AAC.1